MTGLLIILASIIFTFVLVTFIGLCHYGFRIYKGELDLSSGRTNKYDQRILSLDNGFISQDPFPYLFKYYIHDKKTRKSSAILRWSKQAKHIDEKFKELKNEPRTFQG